MKTVMSIFFLVVGAITGQLAVYRLVTGLPLKWTTHRKSERLISELVELCESGAMDASTALETYYSEIGALWLAPWIRRRSSRDLIRDLFEATRMFNADRFDATYPGYTAHNPWRKPFTLP